MQIAVSAGAAGQIGAVLVLASSPGFGVADARLLLLGRIAAVPRLRQRLYRTPPGCGRPYWADDPGFDLDAHVGQVRCPPPGDERALLDMAASLICEPLPSRRPPWSATFVTGLADGSTGLVFVMNHVLADGVAALALLGALADADPDPGMPPFATAVPSVAASRTCPARLAQSGSPPIGSSQSGSPPIRAARVGPLDRCDPTRLPLPPPGLRALAADAWAERARRLANPSGGLRGLRRGLAGLGGGRPRRLLPSTSLNRVTGPRRRIDVVAADLAAIRELGRATGGTVNDVVLAVVAGALRALLASRGEQLGDVTMSVLVSGRQAAGGGQLGNLVGVMPVTVPADGVAGAPGAPGTSALSARVARVAAITRERKSQDRGASGVLVVPGFLLLARVGLLRWFANRQRLIHTFVSNLPGPQQPLTVAGAPVRSILAIPATTGNVTVTFCVLSYAGVLRITVLSDPSRVPDVAVLTAALRQGLDAIPGALAASSCQGTFGPQE